MRISVRICSRSLCLPMMLAIEVKSSLECQQSFDVFLQTAAGDESKEEGKALLSARIMLHLLLRRSAP